MIMVVEDLGKSTSVVLRLDRLKAEYDKAIRSLGLLKKGMGLEPTEGHIHDWSFGDVMIDRREVLEDISESVLEIGRIRSSLSCSAKPQLSKNSLNVWNEFFLKSLLLPEPTSSGEVWRRFFNEFQWRRSMVAIDELIQSLQGNANAVVVAIESWDSI
jgi:hypothetical protein